jgi:hypothetical protein
MQLKGSSTCGALYELGRHSNAQKATRSAIELERNSADNMMTIGKFWQIFAM